MIVSSEVRSFRPVAFAGAWLLVSACGGSGDSGVTNPTTPPTPTNDCRSLLQISTTLPTPQGLWQKSAPTGAAPAARWNESGAYDAANDRMIVYGGTGAAGALNDVWVLSAATSATPTWTQLQPGGPGGPAARSLAVVSYDAPNNRLIVIGGSDANNRILSDAWALSNANGTGGTPQWTQLAVSGTAISRTAIAGVLDPRGPGRPTLFGGVSCTSTACTPSSDVIVGILGPTTISFSRETAESSLIPARYYASAAWDAANSRLIVFGGTSSTSTTTDPSFAVSDVWTISGPSTTPIGTHVATRGGPGGLIQAGLAYDEVLGRMFVYGGTNTDNNVTNGLWLLPLNTGAWSQFDGGSPAPAARASALVFYSPSKDRLIVFGGNGGGQNLLNDVWTIRATPPNAANVRIASAGSSVCAGYELAFAAVAVDSAGNAIPAAITWSSSNPAVLDVSSSGRATALQAGTATIKACAGAVCGQLSADVKAAPAPPPTNNTPSTLRINTQNVGTVTACADRNGAKTSNVTAVTLFADGGAPASGYTWTVSPGSTFPAGTTVDPLTGIFHRTSATSVLPSPGRYRFNMTVSDGSNTATADIQLIVDDFNSTLDPVLQIPSNPCPIALFSQAGTDPIELVSGKVGRSYGSSLYALVGGDPNTNGPVNRNLSWRLADGALPPGLVVDAARGIVRGTPSTAGDYHFTISVKNSDGAAALLPLGRAPTYHLVITN